jgi:hypothetical protein
LPLFPTHRGVTGEACSGAPTTRAAIVLFAAIVVVGALLGAAPALGLHPVAEVLGQEPTPSWTWPEGVPGKPVKVTNFVASLNAGTNPRFGDLVDLGTLREIVSAGATVRARSWPREGWTEMSA